MAEDVAHKFFQDVFRIHGLPDNIVSDRNLNLQHALGSSSYTAMVSKLKWQHHSIHKQIEQRKS